MREGKATVGPKTPARSPLSTQTPIMLAAILAAMVLVGGVGRAETYQSLPIDAESSVNTSNPTTASGLNVATFLGANRFYNAGITGQNTITANVEAGIIWSGHETLTHVTNNVVGTGALGEYDRHATWVGMLIGGRNGGSSQGSWQLGIASGTDLRSGALATGWTGTAYSNDFQISYASFFSTYTAFFGTADVINSSWGGTDTTGAQWYTIAIDALARSNPQTLFVAAAGNVGPSANTVTGAASGYNGISVGALANNGNTYSAIAGFSSRGPQDYYDSVRGTVSGVRAAVDIVAPGDALTSAYYGGQTGGNGPSLSGSPNGSAGGSNYYSTYLAGTSFASPIVAGGASLLASASKTFNVTSTSRDSRVIKAVLMNSADKISGWSNGQTSVDGVITTTQSLDWALGAGRLNLDAAYDQYLSGTQDVAGLAGGNILNLGWDYGRLSSVGNYNDYVFSTDLLGGTLLDVTLTWFRNRTTNVHTYSTSDVSFANFDLEIWDSDFDTLLATSESLYNNSELLHFSLPYSGDYGIRVVYTSQMFGNVTPEYYGLAWSATTVPEPAACVMLATLAAFWLGWHFRRRRALR